VSDAFLRTVRGSHTMVARATVCETFQDGTSPTGTTVEIIDGQVTVDGTADIRSILDLTVDGTGRWPNEVNDLLAPYGNEIFVERGIQYGNGTAEYCSLGYFRIDTPSQPAAPNGPIRVDASDRMAGIIDGRLTTPHQFMSTDTYGAVVTALVTEIYPLATIEWDDSTDADTLDRSLICEQDRYGFLNDLIRSRGKTWFWDHRGVLVIQTAPDSNTPVYTVDAGAGGVLVTASRQITRKQVYNAVVAQGEAPDTQAPVRGMAFDNDAASPTYFSGRFGPVPEFYTSPFLTSDSEAQAAAQAILLRRLGLPYNVDFSTVPNPALEPDDPVKIRYSNDTGVEIHVLDQLVIPLVHDRTMTARTREQSTVLIGVS
jgi:hypothetical protein